ncbi:store-operated calcium entry-associated regulatory factor [Gadus macrocephalus]|uniref:store-operated calcium entry-associated regulatory factor n=1 Tax=Gadus macrocephalus TaxID=80720 RepID=UPI0028CB81A1|nr:store-operated calcium entry-associated regulatory factor [Gadus macrocephalus]
MKRFLLLVAHCLFVVQVKSWNQGSGSVLLRDVQVLTLYKGRFTTAGRSSAIPQIKCIGGSAGCGAFVPEAVQCKNKGWDGVDVQWECKTDMDNSYQFGHIEVSCEGYSHPDDAYILKGSCGLEYTLELTEEGRARQRSGSTHGSKQSGGFGDFASNFFSGFSGSKHQQQGNHQHQQHRGSSSVGSEGGSGSMLGLAILLLLAYGVYKLFLSGNSAQGGHPEPEPGSYPTGHDDRGHTSGPPPPGFKPNFTGSSAGYPGAPPPAYPGDPPPAYPGAPPPGYGFQSGYSSGRQHYPRQQSATPGAGGGGFWTGLGTGGALGYLFGSQRNQPYNSNFSASGHIPRPAQAPSFSSGTRSASGFGGTKRR